MKQDGDELRRVLHSYLESDEEHPDLEDVLFRYADGTLDDERRAAVDAHLEHCSRCREDVADAVSAQRSIRPVRRNIPWLIAAAVAAMAVAATLWWTRNGPATAARPDAQSAALPAAWQQLVREARAARRIDAPAAWRALQIRPAREQDVLRGHLAPHSGGTFSPSGTVVETQQPPLSWPAMKNAAYVVKVFQQETAIAQSPLLRDNHWTLPQPLARGATYVWQVDVHRTTVTIVPAPPDPPALFTVLDEREAAGIADARRRFPDDHLLLGVLYAHAGVRDRAEEELGLWTAAHPADAAARDLLASIGDW